MLRTDLTYIVDVVPTMHVGLSNGKGTYILPRLLDANRFRRADPLSAIGRRRSRVSVATRDAASTADTSSNDPDR